MSSRRHWWTPYRPKWKPETEYTGFRICKYCAVVRCKGFRSWWREMREGCHE